MYWNGAVAVGSSTLQYFGNRATQELKIEATSGGRTSTVSGLTSDSHIVPDVYEFTHPGIVTSPGQQACGGTANLTAKYSAWIVLFVEIKGLLTIDPAQKSGSDVRYQPACPPEPCPTTVSDPAEGPVRLAGAGGTLCYDDENIGGGGGGGGDCPDCVNTPAGPTYCRIRYWYWMDTGEIFASQILWCA